MDKLPRIVYPPNAIPIDIPADLVIPKDEEMPNEKVIVYTTTHKRVNLYRLPDLNQPAGSSDFFGGHMSQLLTFLIQKHLKNM